MKTNLELLKTLKEKDNQTDFNQVLEKTLAGLNSYIQHRINVYEAKKILPKNFYSATDVITDVYLAAYRNLDQMKNERHLKVYLFSMAETIIKSYIDKENKIKKTIPVDTLVQEELKTMYEKLTANAEGKPVLVSQLTDEDISYEQDEFKPKIFLFDIDSQKAFANSLGLNTKDLRDEKLGNIFGNIYSQLPETIRQVLDMNAIGNLSYDEIAEIINIKTDEVAEIIVSIQKIVKAQ